MQGRKVCVFAFGLESPHDVVGFACRHARAFALAKRFVARCNSLVAFRGVLGVGIQGQIAELQACGFGGLEQRLKHVFFEVNHLLLQAAVGQLFSQVNVLCFGHRAALRSQCILHVFHTSKVILQIALDRASVGLITQGKALPLGSLPYRVAWPFKLTPASAFANSARLVANSLACASAFWAGVKTTGGCVVDRLVDAPCFEFFVCCILKFLPQTFFIDHWNFFKWNYGKVTVASAVVDRDDVEQWVVCKIFLQLEHSFV